MQTPKANIARATMRAPIVRLARASARTAPHAVAAQLFIPFGQVRGAASTPPAVQSAPATNVSPRPAAAEEDRHAAFYAAQQRLAGVAGLGIDSTPRGCASLDAAARRMTRPALRSVMVGVARFADGKLELRAIR